MSSCLWLEQPGKWRILVVTLILGLVLLPAVPLAVQALPIWNLFGIDRPFMSSLANSTIVAFLVLVLSLILGLPAGVCTALYHWPGRRAMFALTGLPLLVPSFLWAI